MGSPGVCTSTESSSHLSGKCGVWCGASCKHTALALDFHLLSLYCTPGLIPTGDL